MHYKVLLFIIIALIGAFFYLHTINPAEVTYVLAKDYKYVLPVTYLVLVGFIAGVLLTVINSLFVDLKRAFRDFRHRREHKKTEAIEANYRQGVSALYRGDPVRARGFLNKAVDENPIDADLYLRLAEAYVMEGNPVGAMDVLDKGVVKIPGSTELLLKLSEVADKAGDSRKEERALNEILRLDESNPHALKRLKEISVGSRDFSRAVDLQKRYLHGSKHGKGPGGEEAQKREETELTGLLYEDALRLVDSESYGEAESRLKEILKRDDAFLPAHMLMGEIFKRQGNLTSAVRIWERAYERLLAPVFFLKLEDVYLEQSKPETLLEKYRDAVLKSPQDVDLSLLLSRLYLRLSMVEEAVGELERIKNYVEESYYMELLLGEAYMRSKQAEKAAVMFQKALGLDMELPPAFSCKHCGEGSGEWLPRCSECGEWNSMRISRTTTVARESVPERYTNVRLVK